MLDVETLVEDLYPYDFDDNQIFFIYQGLKNGLDISKYCSSDFDASQMEQIYLGLLHEINVDIYSLPSLSSIRMKIVRIALENNTFSDDMLLESITDREAVQISKYNGLSVNVKKDYYKLRKERLEKEKQEINKEELDNIDFDSILDEEDNDISIDLFSNEINSDINANSLMNDNYSEYDVDDEYEYYFENFYEHKLYSNYYEIMKNYPLLKQEEEIFYFKQYSSGKEYIEGWNISNEIKKSDNKNIINKANAALNALNVIFMSNIKLAISYANRYNIETIEHEDLYFVAFEGLLKAVNSFEYNKGFKFSTYAVWRIRQSLSRFIMDNERIIRIPVHAVERYNKIIKFEKDYYEINGCYPTEKIYKKNCLLQDNETIKEFKLIFSPILSIEDQIKKYGPDEFYSTVVNGVVASKDKQREIQLKDAMNKILSTLTEREEQVLRIRFGLVDGEAKTLEEVGKIFGVTRERIRQIEAKALKKLKNPIKCSDLKNFM